MSWLRGGFDGFAVQFERALDIDDLSAGQDAAHGFDVEALDPIRAQAATLEGDLPLDGEGKRVQVVELAVPVRIHVLGRPVPLAILELSVGRHVAIPGRGEEAGGEREVVALMKDPVEDDVLGEQQGHVTTDASAEAGLGRPGGFREHGEVKVHLAQRNGLAVHALERREAAVVAGHTRHLEDHVHLPGDSASMQHE